MVRIKITNIDTGVEYETSTPDLEKYFKECHRLVGIKTYEEIDLLVQEFKRHGYIQIPYRMYGFNMVISCMQIRN